VCRRGKTNLGSVGGIMAATRPTRKDSVDVLLDKINHMWEELLTIERALERMQKDAVELTQRRNGSGKAR